VNFLEDNDAAIFWDYENVRLDAQKSNVPMAESLMSYLKTVGHPRVKKVYCNWKNINQAIIQALYSMGFDPIQVSMGKTNSVDVKLTVDCMSTAFKYPSINHFIIVTGDKDYIPLVNWLRDNRKNIIIVGNTSTVSDHLMISADDFISLEDLLKVHQTTITIQKDETKIELLSSNDAIDCLKEAINQAREQGKSSRLAVIGHLMRTNENYDYRGANFVEEKKDKGFASFSDFINFAEEQEAIKVHMFENFKELFLLEEEPKIESEFSPTLKDRIEKKDWSIILKEIAKSFDIKPPEKTSGHWFIFLYKVIRSLKKTKQLPYSNNKLKEALSTLVDVGFLLEQQDGCYALNREYSSNMDEWLDTFIPE